MHVVVVGLVGEERRTGQLYGPPTLYEPSDSAARMYDVISDREVLGATTG